MKNTMRKSPYDKVLAFVGWDTDGNLRIEEENGWETAIAWGADPVLFEFCVPEKQRPDRREKKAPIPVVLDGYKV